MEFNCLIVDDEQPARNVIKRYINDVPFLNLMAECQNGIEAFSILKEYAVDVIFLDIEMPKLTGLDFLRSLEKQPKIVITTAYREFALDGFDLNVVDYLLKPIAFERFITAVNKLNSPVAKELPDIPKFTYFKSGKKSIQVFFDDILYIEGLGNYVKIFTPEQVITTYDQLTNITDKLPRNQFVRIHRSYIVALNKIRAYGSDYAEIGIHQLSIGNTYKEEFINTISNFKNQNLY